MKQNLKFVAIFCVILTFGAYQVKGEEKDGDEELTLRNQLFADVFLLKEGVDRLQISVEVLNKRYSNQLDILKDVQTKMVADDNGDDDFSDKMSSYFNATFRKYNLLENKLVTKLDEIQEEQTTRLDTILLKQGKSCASNGGSSTTLTMMSSVLSDVNEKINNFEEQLKKLETLEEKFNLQQSKLEANHQAHLKILQEINEKLTKNQEKFDKLEKDLPNLKDAMDKVNQMTFKKTNRLPMEVILGVLTSNATKLN